MSNVPTEDVVDELGPVLATLAFAAWGYLLVRTLAAIAHGRLWVIALGFVVAVPLTMLAAKAVVWVVRR